jgi:hypothetical protein
MLEGLIPMHIKEIVISLIIFCGCLSQLIRSMDARLISIERDKKVYQAPPLSTLPRPIVNIATLGYKAVYDDFINLWLLQILTEKNKPQNPEELLNVINTVTSHKPPIETLYMLSCFVMMQEFNRPETCKRIILDGLSAIPNSWRLPMTQGYVQAFITKEPAQAASFFQMAASREQSPEWVKKVAIKLVRENKLAADDISKSLEIIEAYPEAKELLKFLPPRSMPASHNLQH